MKTCFQLSQSTFFYTTISVIALIFLITIVLITETDFLHRESWQQNSVEKNVFR